MGRQANKKKLVPNRPPPKQPVISDPTSVRMIPKPQRKLVPPDGGWGWIVVLGACFSFFFFPAVTVAYGVLFTGRLSELGAGATEFTSIANGLSIVWSFMAVLMPPVIELYGYRRPVFIGGLFCFLTLLLVAFSPNLVTFGLSYSFFGGMACALSTFPGFVIIPLYFTRRKGLANGLVSTAFALGKIVMAPLCRLLMNEYGYVWACLLIGALALHSCFSSMLYHPPHWHMIPSPCEDELQHCKSGSNKDRETEVDGKQATHHRLQSEPHQEEKGTTFLMSTTPPPPTTFLMSTTPPPPTTFLMSTTPPPPSQGAELQSLGGVEACREEQLKILTMGSETSLFSSLPVLAPSDYKVHADDEDKKECCFTSCFLVKPFLMLDYTMLREPNFHLIAWPGALFIAGYLNFAYALPGYVTSLGYSHYQSAFTISAFSATDVVFRLLIAILSDFSWFPKKFGYISGIALTALTAGCITLVPSYTWVLVWMVVLGVAISLFYTLGIHIILEYFSSNQYGKVVGFSALMNGIITAFVGFITGLVRDYTDSFRASFFFLTAILSLATGVWMCREWVVHYSTKVHEGPPTRPHATLSRLYTRQHISK